MNDVNKPSATLDRIRERVRAELDDRSMTIQALADAAGISRVWLSRFLRGEVALSFADADAIAIVFGTTTSELGSEKILA